MLKEYGVRVWAALMWLRIEPVVSSYKRCNETYGSTNVEKILDYLGDYQLLKKDSAPRSYLVS
jgi:hypothetical protein